MSARLGAAPPAPAADMFARSHWLAWAAAGGLAVSAMGGYVHTQRLVDQEVAALLTRAESRARDLISTHQNALDQLTAALLEQETISGDQVRAIVQATSPAPPRNVIQPEQRRSPGVPGLAPRIPTTSASR